MGDGSKIEWCDSSVNPIRAKNKASSKVGWFCEHVTPGCEHCYSEAINRRLGTGVDFKRQNRERVELFLDDKLLTDPLRWRKPRRIFWNSMADTFGDFVPDDFIDRQFAVMALTPQHTHIVLTKRAKRMREYIEGLTLVRMIVASTDLPCLLIDVPPWPLPNVWLGCSVEDQTRADERIPELLATPAARRFISAEPLLGPVVLSNYGTGSSISWGIVGGESGPAARPMRPDWARSLRDQCAAAGVPFFFKQWGEFYPDDDAPDAHTAMRRVGKKAAGRLLDGREHNEFPTSQTWR